MLAPRAIVTMNIDIPGYYFGGSPRCTTTIGDVTDAFPDPEKKKYFKIEKSHTAPLAAAYAAHNVKRRKRHAADTEARERRAKLTQRHIKRSRALREPGLGGLLNRELGLRDPSLGGRRSAADVPAAIFAAKLCDRGCIYFRDSEILNRRAAHPECFWVGSSPGSAGRIFCCMAHGSFINQPPG